MLLKPLLHGQSSNLVASIYGAFPLLQFLNTFLLSHVGGRLMVTLMLDIDGEITERPTNDQRCLKGKHK